MPLLLPSLALFLYAVCSLVLPSPCRLWAKALGSVALLLVSLKYVWYEKLGGSFLTPAVPHWFQLGMEALYGALVMLVFLLLFKDALTLLLWIARLLGVSWHLPFSRGARALSLLFLGLASGFWGTWQAMRVPDVQTKEITLPTLPASMDGFTIIQLTDLHIGPLLKKDWLQEVVTKVNAQEPDLVVITGDFIDILPDKAEEIAPLEDLRARYGVFGVTGNHEYYNRAAEWTPIFKKLGVQMLHNEHRVLAIGQEKLIIAGMPDLWEARKGGPGPDIQRTLRDAPKGVRILLEHQPRGAARNTAADLQLSGHTHGGHLFFLKPLIASFNDGFVHGLYRVGDMQLYVSPGTGLWGGFSCRVGVPSEITRLVLRAPTRAATGESALSQI